VSIEIRCEGCGQRYRVADEAAGKQSSARPVKQYHHPAAPVAVGGRPVTPRDFLRHFQSGSRLPVSRNVLSAARGDSQQGHNRRRIADAAQRPPAAISLAQHRTLLIVGAAVLVCAVVLSGATLATGSCAVRWPHPESGRPRRGLNDADFNPSRRTWSGTHGRATRPRLRNF